MKFTRGIALALDNLAALFINEFSGGLHFPSKIRISYRLLCQKIYASPKERLESFRKSEITIRVRFVRLPVRKLDDEIQITGVGIKPTTRARTENKQPANFEAAAQLCQCWLALFDERNHDCILNQTSEDLREI